MCETDKSETVELTPSPENATQLAHLIESLTVFECAADGEGYSKSAEAIWQAAVAAFDYVSRRVGATDFQASWAALKFYGEAMRVDGPFIILKVEDALYPHHDLPRRVQRFIDEQRPWLRQQAAERLNGYEVDPIHISSDEEGVERSSPTAHPSVVAHWRKLAAT